MPSRYRSYSAGHNDLRVVSYGSPPQKVMDNVKAETRRDYFDDYFLMEAERSKSHVADIASRVAYYYPPYGYYATQGTYHSDYEATPPGKTYSNRTPTANVHQQTIRTTPDAQYTVPAGQGLGITYSGSGTATSSYYHQGQGGVQVEEELRSRLRRAGPPIAYYNRDLYNQPHRAKSAISPIRPNSSGRRSQSRSRSISSQSRSPNAGKPHLGPSSSWTSHSSQHNSPGSSSRGRSPSSSSSDSTSSTVSSPLTYPRGFLDLEYYPPLGSTDTPLRSYQRLDYGPTAELRSAFDDWDDDDDGDDGTRETYWGSRAIKQLGGLVRRLSRSGRH